MTRQEFLARLREALESELDRRTVQENVDYYSSYIIEETAKGRPESDVIAELGDPWVIARSVIGMSADSLGAEDAYDAAGGRGHLYPGGAPLLPAGPPQRRHLARRGGPVQFFLVQHPARSRGCGLNCEESVKECGSLNFSPISY